MSRTLSRLKKEGGMPGSSPVGYIVIQRGDGVGEEKHIYIELKTEIRKVYCSRKIGGEKRLNNLVYVESL